MPEPNHRNARELGPLCMSEETQCKQLSSVIKENPSDEESNSVAKSGQYSNLPELHILNANTPGRSEPSRPLRFGLYRRPRSSTDPLDIGTHDFSLMPQDRPDREVIENVGSPIDEVNEKRRHRLSAWARRHHLLPGNRRRRAQGGVVYASVGRTKQSKRKSNEKELKRGCTVLHTSTNRHSRITVGSPKFPIPSPRVIPSKSFCPACDSYSKSNRIPHRRSSQVLASIFGRARASKLDCICGGNGTLSLTPSKGYGMDNRMEGSLCSSFHSCYSYERTGYEWWWYNTAAEVVRSYLTSLACRVDGFVRPSARKSLASHTSSGLQFTPRLDATFNSCVGSEVLSQAFQQVDTFWEIGFSLNTLRPNAHQIFKTIRNLDPRFPEARNGIYMPPIHEMAQIGWSDIEECQKGGYPALRAPTTRAEIEMEITVLAQSMRGHWISVINRCSDIEPVFKIMGIPYVKRSILARIAIPLTMFLEDQYSDDAFTNLHTWIHTPLGLRHINWSTVGDKAVDNDPDAGIWEGLVRVISIYLPTMERPVRALQRMMVRPGNPKSGMTIETRCVLPDYHEGRILFFQIDAYPCALSGDYVTGAIHSSRVLRFEHPVDDVKEMTSKTALTEAGALKGCTRLNEELIL